MSFNLSFLLSLSEEWVLILFSTWLFRWFVEVLLLVSSPAGPSFRENAGTRGPCLVLPYTQQPPQKEGKMRTRKKECSQDPTQLLLLYTRIQSPSAHAFWSCRFQAPTSICSYIFLSFWGGATSMEHNCSLCSLQGGESVSSQVFRRSFHHCGVGVCQRICDNCCSSQL